MKQLIILLLCIALCYGRASIGPKGPLVPKLPVPLIQLGNNTYYFEHTLEANWADAKAFCRNAGLFLLSVEDEAENELIKEHLRQTGNGDYWSSGNDLGQKNRWVWDSTGREVTFTDWHPGQPNHAWGFDGTDHIILYLQEKDGTIAWNDYPEGRQFHIICKQLN